MTSKDYSTVSARQPEHRTLSDTILDLNLQVIISKLFVNGKTENRKVLTRFNNR